MHGDAVHTLAGDLPRKVNKNVGGLRGKAVGRPGVSSFSVVAADERLWWF